MNTEKESNRKHPRFWAISVKSLPESTREQLARLVDGRGFTTKTAVIVALRDLDNKERGFTTRAEAIVALRDLDRKETKGEEG